MIHYWSEFIVCTMFDQSLCAFDVGETYAETSKTYTSWLFLVCEIKVTAILCQRLELFEQGMREKSVTTKLAVVGVNVDRFYVEVYSLDLFLLGIVVVAV